MDLAALDDAAVGNLDSSGAILLVGEGYETEALGAVVTSTTDDTGLDELAALEDILHALLIDDVREVADVSDILRDGSVDCRATRTTICATRTTSLLLLGCSRGGSAGGGGGGASGSGGRGGSLLALAERTLAREGTTSDLDDDGDAAELLAVQHLAGLCDVVGVLKLDKGIKVVLNATILLDGDALNGASRSDESVDILPLASGGDLADEHDAGGGGSGGGGRSGSGRGSGRRSSSSSSGSSGHSESHWGRVKKKSKKGKEGEKKKEGEVCTSKTNKHTHTHTQETHESGVRGSTKKY